MADTKVSGLTAVVTPAATDEFPVNQSAVSKKVTLAQVLGAGVIVGRPKTPTASFTVLDGWEHDVIGRLTLASTVRATLAGTADLIIGDDFGARSRIVLAGRGF